MSKSYNVGVVGCGNIADQHLKFLSKMEQVHVVGLADVNIDNANKLGEKYEIGARFTSLEEMLEAQSIDVLHVCTPPADHYAQAKLAINKGIHVLLEKPLSVHSSEVAELFESAIKNNVQLCPDFIQLFLPCMSKANDLIKEGSLGKIIRVECFYGFDAIGSEVNKSIGLPWSYKLPGGIFHNHLAHPLYLVLNLIGNPRSVQVDSRSYGVLPQNMTDHLEILIKGDNANGYITMSVVPKTPFYYIRILCEKGAIHVDLLRLNVVLDAKGEQPGAIYRFLSNFNLANQQISAGIANILNIIKGKLVSYQGMQKLFEVFYKGLDSNLTSPIESTLAVAVARTEEKIAAEIEKKLPDVTPHLLKQSYAAAAKRVLVTGASGFLGTSIVKKLVNAGFIVRAFVRPLSHVSRLEENGVEVVFGDVRSFEDLEKAAEGIDFIVHAAAGMQGSRDVLLETSVKGVENVTQISQIKKIKKVIYISSSGVYDYANLRNGSFITEKSEVEKKPEMRGPYTLAKCKAEEVALKNLNNAQVAWTILRPGILFAENPRIHTLIACFQVNNLVFCFTNPWNFLRIVHVDDVAEGVVLSLENDESAGKVFNISDSDPIRVKQFIKLSKPKEFGKQLHFVYIPQFVMLTASLLLQGIKKLFKKVPSISSRQLAYWYRNCRIDSSQIIQKLGWHQQSKYIKN